MGTTVTSIVAALIGTGGVGAACGAIFKGIRMRKQDYESMRREHLQDLARWRDDLDSKLQQMDALLRYYQGLAGHYEYQLRSNGITPQEPEGLVKPSV
jgi:lactate dehydrogenase-like 2-hydroxyacid dehydrogenase